MSKKTKKAMSMLLVVALIAVIAIGGMLAYLTDRDSKANVFTVGDVKIDLTEDFNQGATLTPGVDVEKEVRVTNTGKNDAYVWVTIAVPAALDNDDASKNVLHFNYSKESIGDGFWTWKDNGNWIVEEKTIDGVTYKEYTAMYESALKAGEETEYPAMTKVYLDKALDIAPNGDWYIVKNGNTTKIDWNSQEQPVVYVSAYAIQADTFNSVQDARAAYYAQWGDNGDEYAEIYAVCDEATVVDGVVTLSNGESAYIEGEQKPFTVKGKGTLYLRNLSINANEGSAITIGETADVKLVVEGTTKVVGVVNGINALENTKLDLSGKGNLTAIGGSGDDASALPGSGIGGAGEIYIHDLKSLVAEGYGKAGFGIGGYASNITIENTTIDYVKGGYVQPNFVNDTSYGKSEPEGGAAIGSMTDGAVITLKNTVIEKADGGSKAAAIGARYWTGVTINIDGCTIKEANGGNASAGIGGSRIAEDFNSVADAVTININDSIVKATGGEFAAGIGSGYDTHCAANQPLHTINISGNSEITAIGGKYAAGIGTGYHVASLAGKIESSVTVNATAGESREKYTKAMDVGFGVIDKTREGKDSTSSFDNKGTLITVADAPDVN